MQERFILKNGKWNKEWELEKDFWRVSKNLGYDQNWFRNNTGSIEFELYNNSGGMEHIISISPSREDFSVFSKTRMGRRERNRVIKAVNQKIGK